MNKSVLVTGSTGQVGRSIMELSKTFPGFDFDFLSRKQLDLSSETSIETALQKPYDYIINAGAYTKVDQAEEDSELCYAINAEALRHIAKYSSDKAVVIHFSTDYVYDINTTEPLNETDETHPRSVYAKSKLKGEKYLSQSKAQHIIIRTSWVYAAEGHNFVNSMLRLGSERDQLSIVSDQKGTPSYAPDIAETVLHIISRLSEKNPDDGSLYGIYNYSNEGQTNWADFARTIFLKSGIECTVAEISTQKFNAPAPRPLWSVMSKDKIKSSFGLSIPHWERSLDKCLDRIKQKL